jgi:predicted DNA-binding transcriptional regulator AlpA
MEYVVIALVVFCVLLIIGVLHYKSKSETIWRYANRKNINYNKHLSVLHADLANAQHALAKAENKLSNQNKAKQVKAYIFYYNKSYNEKDKHYTYASLRQAEYMTGISRPTIKARIADGKPHYSKKLKTGLIFKH